MGNHLYEENKRLTRENDDLRRQLREKKQLDNEDNLDALAREAFKQILTGKAAFVIGPGNDPEYRICNFQMLPVPKLSDEQPL